MPLRGRRGVLDSWDLAVFQGPLTKKETKYLVVGRLGRWPSPSYITERDLKWLMGPSSRPGYLV